MNALGPRARWIIAIVVSTVIYIIGFIVLELRSEEVTSGGVLVTVPVVLIALRTGKWGGLIAAVVGLGVNAALYAVLSGPESVRTMFDPTAGGGAALVEIPVGWIVGYLSDVRRKLTQSVDERVEANAKLRLERHRLDELLNSLGGVVWEMDSETGSFTYVSTRAADVLGVEHATQPLGLRWSDIVHPDDQEMINTEAILRDVDSGTTEVDFRVQLDTEETRWVRNISTGRTGNDGKTVSGILLDITARHALEQEILESRQRAIDGMDLRTQALNRLSHEIRTPLNGVIGLVRLLDDPKLPGSYREYVHILRDATDNLSQLVNDALDFARLESGRLEIVESSFQIHQVVETVTSTFAALAQAKGLEIVAQVEENVPDRVLSDPGRLRQVLANLVGNAVKFTDSGAVVVHVRLEGDLQPNPGDVARLLFEVRDSGFGISPQSQAQIFTPFFRAGDTAAARRGGTGLGLAISKQIVEQLGGFLTMDSALGEGTTFAFLLPMQVEALTDSQVGEALETEGVRVLTVAATDRIQKGLAMQFASLGVRVAAVEDFESARTIAAAAEEEADGFSLVLLDIHGAEMERKHFPSFVDSARAQIPVVPMVNLASLDSYLHLKESSPFGIVSKPVRRESLEVLLSSVIRSQIVSSRSGTFLTNGLTPSSVELPGVPRLVLVAEDNIINQKVITRTLERIGYKAHVVGTGDEAYEEAITGLYELVLMDCHMPGMDGFEATRRIRETMEEEDRRLPILAYTAEWTKENRQRCFESGMDDILLKPVTPEGLESALNRWSDKEPTSKVVTKVSGTHTHPPSKVVDWTVLDGLGDMDDPRERAEILDMLQLFLTQTPGEVDEMKALIDSEDWPAFDEAVHHLKGSCGVVGARGVAKHCDSIREGIAKNNYSSAVGVFDELVEEIEAVFQVFGTILAEG